MREEQEKLIEEYGEYLTIEGLSRRTVYQYKNYILKFIEYLEDRRLDFIEVRVKEAQEYQGWILEKEKHLSSGTVLNILKSTVSFYKYLQVKKLVYTNPFLKIKKIKEERKLPSNVLNEKEMQKVLKEIRKFEEEKTIKGKVRRYKVHVIAELMYATGMRVSEVAKLTSGNIDLEAGVIKLEGVKNERVRLCFLNEYAKVVLEQYMKRIKEYTTYRYHTDETLFGCKAHRLEIVISMELKKACRKAGVKEISSHGFRHSFGSHLLKAGCSIRYIQALLGHKRLRSTEVYTKIDKEDLKRVIEKYHPRKWKEH